MDPGVLVDSVIRGVLGGRRKRSRNALSFLTGRRPGIWSNPSTLLAAAGVAWGIFETLQKRRATGAATASGDESGSSSVARDAARGNAGENVGPGAMPPPLPDVSAGAISSAASSSPATSSTASSSAVPAPPPIPHQSHLADDGLLMIRLAISAANADGAMNDAERAVVMQQATDAGLRNTIERELRQPRPLVEIVAGVTDASERATLYVLAYTIVRADEQISDGERVYLSQLASLLGLESSTVRELERSVGERIDALGDQGQLGG